MQSLMADFHKALVYIMVLASAADTDMTDAELKRIGEIISNLPVFEDFDMESLAGAVDSCVALLEDEDGLEKAFTSIRKWLPRRLRETAYALACDVVAADGEVHQEELRLLEMARHRLDIDRLIAAGIERGARARFAPQPPEK